MFENWLFPDDYEESDQFGVDSDVDPLYLPQGSSDDYSSSDQGKEINHIP